MSANTTPARPSGIPGITTVAEEPRVPRELNNFGRAIIWGVIAIISLLLFAGSLVWATWLVGIKAADGGAVLIVGIVGVSPIVGFILATIGQISHRMVTGFIGLGLIALGGLLFGLVFLAWGGTAGLFGAGWVGILVFAFVTLTVTAIIYTVRAARR